MKKIISSFALLLLLTSAFQAAAQKQVAMFNSKTSKQSLDEKTVKINFELSNISKEEANGKFLTSFKSAQGIHDVTVNTEPGNKASYFVTLPKGGTAKTIQTMLGKAGISTVNVDGKEMPLASLPEYLKAEKAKK